MKTVTDEAGFSLLEVLIALAIISMATTLLVVSVPRWLDREALSTALVGFDEASLFASAQARRSGYPSTLVVSPPSLVVQTPAGSRRWHLPSVVELSITSAQELQRDGKPKVIFFADGTSSGAEIGFRVGSFKQHRHVGWLTRGGADAR